jgi:hypothetical protein
VLLSTIYTLRLQTFHPFKDQIFTRKSYPIAMHTIMHHCRFPPHNLGRKILANVRKTLFSGWVWVATAVWLAITISYAKPCSVRLDHLTWYIISIWLLNVRSYDMYLCEYMCVCMYVCICESIYVIYEYCM